MSYLTCNNTNELVVLEYNGVAVRQPLDIGVRTNALHAVFGTTCDIAFSDWLNTYMLVTAYGEIRVGYLQDCISAFTDSHRRRKAMVGFTDVIDVTKTTTEPNSNGPPNASESPIDHVPDHAIVFSDLARVLSILNYTNLNYNFFFFFSVSARKHVKHSLKYKSLSTGTER